MTRLAADFPSLFKTNESRSAPSTGSQSTGYCQNRAAVSRQICRLDIPTPSMNDRVSILAKRRAGGEEVVTNEEMWASSHPQPSP